MAFVAAHAAISAYLGGDRTIDEKGGLSEQELPQLKRFTELTLAGSVGAGGAVAHSTSVTAVNMASQCRSLPERHEFLSRGCALLNDATMNPSSGALCPHPV